MFICKKVRFECLYEEIIYLWMSIVCWNFLISLIFDYIVIRNRVYFVGFLVILFLCMKNIWIVIFYRVCKGRGDYFVGWCCFMSLWIFIFFGLYFGE